LHFELSAVGEIIAFLDVGLRAWKEDCVSPD